MALQLSRSLTAAKRTTLPSLTSSTAYSLPALGLDRMFFSKLATPKLSVSMCLNGNRANSPGFHANTALKYTEDQSDHLMEPPAESYPTVEPSAGKVTTNGHVNEETTPQPQRYAKLHDFCLGIPFGGIVFGGGLLGFLLTKNPVSLLTGVLFGGAILAMGVTSLKVWRKGISSLPLILGQAVLAAALLWKHLQIYSLTRKLFPTGVYVTMSAAMLCFYSYVVISGGNPPPKKRLAAAPPS